MSKYLKRVHKRLIARVMRADEDTWKTINGTHVLVEEGTGEIKKGPQALKEASKKKSSGKSSAKTIKYEKIPYRALYKDAPKEVQKQKREIMKKFMEDVEVGNRYSTGADMTGSKSDFEIVSYNRSPNKMGIRDKSGRTVALTNDNLLEYIKNGATWVNAERERNKTIENNEPQSGSDKETEYYRIEKDPEQDKRKKKVSMSRKAEVFNHLLDDDYHAYEKREHENWLSNNDPKENGAKTRATKKSNAYKQMAEAIKDGGIPRMLSAKNEKETKDIYKAIADHGDLTFSEKRVFDKIKYFKNEGRIYFNGKTMDVNGCTDDEIKGAKMFMAASSADHSLDARVAKPVDVSKYSFKDYNNPDWHNRREAKTLRSSLEYLAKETETVRDHVLRRYSGGIKPEEQSRTEFGHLMRNVAFRDIASASAQQGVKDAHKAIGQRQSYIIESLKPYTEWRNGQWRIPDNEKKASQ